jgi:hypothetical protein
MPFRYLNDFLPKETKMKTVHTCLCPQGTFEHIISASSAIGVKMYLRPEYIKVQSYMKMFGRHSKQ